MTTSLYGSNPAVSQPCRNTHRRLLAAQRKARTRSFLSLTARDTLISSGISVVSMVFAASVGLTTLHGAAMFLAGSAIGHLMGYINAYATPKG